MNSNESEGFVVPTLVEISREIVAQIIWRQGEGCPINAAIQESPDANPDNYVTVEMQMDNYENFYFSFYISWDQGVLELQVASARGLLGHYCEGYAEGFVECFNALPRDRMADALKTLECQRAKPYAN